MMFDKAFECFMVLLLLCRSWDKVFVVVKGSTLSFYKDSKTYKATPDQLYRGEAPIDLLDANASIADDYTKKKNVFRLK